MKKLTASIVNMALLGLVPVCAADEPTEVQVSFDVLHTNTSKVPCDTDGAAYTVEGSIVGPTSALAASGGAITLYLHGSTIGEIQWRVPVAGYDYAWEMAKLGHVSLAIDQLGYERSGHPDGNRMCVGSLADVAHQIVGKLRSGDYRYGGGTPGPIFDRVAIAGNSMGGVVAEVEAYSYGDVDALIQFGAGNQTVTLALLAPKLVQPFATTCAQGGEPPEDGWTEPSGYAYTWPSAESELEDAAYCIEEPVANVIAATRNRDSCANQASILAPGLAIHQLYVGDIHVPVLSMYGEHDKVVGPQPYMGEMERHRYTGSDDVTVVINEDEGHVGMLECRAGVFRARVSEWLKARGF